MLGILMYIQYIPVPALRAAPADALLATILVGVLQAFKTIK
jgi:hypothetical protein